MLKSLKIQNFQSHKNSYLEFHPGVNIILGPSNSGKTSIIRALRWLIWNRPQGDSFKSYWGGDTTVKLETNDASVERYRSDTVNSYCLNNSITYKALKAEVPEEIRRVLNIDEINLQKQLDPHFLLSNTPGEIAQYFNKIVNLEIIDTATQRVNSVIRDISQTINFKKSEKTRLENELKQFDYLKSFEKDLEQIELLDNQLESISSQTEELNNIIHLIENIDNELDTLSELLPAEKLIMDLILFFEDLKKVQEESQMIKSIMNSIIDMDVKIQEIENITEAETYINNILDLYKVKNEISKQCDSLSLLIEMIEKAESNLDNAVLKLSELEIEFEERMPDICPLCGSVYKRQNTKN